MNRIGIRAHDVGKMSAHELSQKIRSLGFDGVQLVFKKALDQPVDFAHLNEIKHCFKDLKVMMLGAYFNPVHPDQKVVIEGIDYFKKHLEIAYALGAKYVGSETGSLMGSPWGYVPENHTQETLNQVIEIFKDLTMTAQKYNSYIALEGAYAHVAYSPKRVKEMIDKIASPRLKVTIDLYNFLHIGNYESRMDIFEEALDLLKDDIVIFHLKDFIVEEGKLKQVGLGQGLMNYPKIIERIQETIPHADLIFEDVTGEDIQTSYQLIHDLLERK